MSMWYTRMAAEGREERPPEERQDMQMVPAAWVPSHPPWSAKRTAGGCTCHSSSG